MLISSYEQGSPSSEGRMSPPYEGHEITKEKKKKDRF